MIGGAKHSGYPAQRNKTDSIFGQSSLCDYCGTMLPDGIACAGVKELVAYTEVQQPCPILIVLTNAMRTNL